MSAFVVKHIRMESCVVPFALRNIKLALQQMFSGDLFRYIPELGGVLVGWQDISLLEAKVRLQSELDGSTWVPFTASLLVWSPKVGDLLRGRIVKHGSDFISVVVHDIWNAMIPYTELPRHFNREVKYMSETDHYVQFAVKELKSVDQTLSLVGTLKAPNTGFVGKDNDSFEPSTSLLRHLKLVDKSVEEDEVEADQSSAVRDGDEGLTLSTKTSSNDKSKKQKKTAETLSSPTKVLKTPTKTPVQPEVKKKVKKEAQPETPASEEKSKNKKRKERPTETDSDGVAEQEPKAKKSKTTENESQQKASKSSSKSTPGKSTPGKSK